MALNYQKKEEVFSTVVEGIPEVVELITSFPPEKHPAAVAAAQQVYLETGERSAIRKPMLSNGHR
jgi:hypothetical protein